jgi:hypothetical protein
LDFSKALVSDEVRVQCAAACFLRARGANGASYLPELLRRCQNVAITDPDLPPAEEMLFAYGARTLGTICNAVGFDAADAIHVAIKDWLIQLAMNGHAEIAGTAIYGLGDLGVPPVEVRDKLEDLVQGERRPDDFDIITCRGTAFRMLAKSDRDTASRYSGFPACDEYLFAVRNWLESRPVDHALLGEIQWLHIR